MAVSFTMLLCLALTASDPPAAAPPEPPPIPPAGQASPPAPAPPASAPTAAPASTPPPSAPTNTPAATPPPSTPSATPAPAPPPGASSTVEPTPPAAAPPPQRLWVILDYYKEFGGTVLREDEASITLRTVDGDERRVDRNSIVNAIPLLDDAEGTRVLIRMRDGRVLRGELVSDGFDAVVTRIQGVRTTLPRGDVFALERELPFETRLAQFRSRIPADAWDVRLDLVRWLLSEGRPEIALEELKAIRKNADSDEAARLMRRAEAEWQLQQKRLPAGGRAPTGASTRTENFPRLSDDDVNLIRVMEVDLRTPPRMRANRDLADRIVRQYAQDDRLPPPADRAGMVTWPAARLLDLLFTLKARDLYGQVRVDEDPEHLRLFRKRVHDGWLVPNCATSRCHGGTAAGRFMLSNVDPGSARTAYTNLLVLLGYRTADGHPLVDFDDPVKSPLLGLGRPRNEAVVPHPMVPGWQPTPAGQRRTTEEDAIAWIRGMHRPRPAYPVTFQMPQPPAKPAPGSASTDER